MDAGQEHEHGVGTAGLIDEPLPIQARMPVDKLSQIAGPFERAPEVLCPSGGQEQEQVLGR